jgi:hypothetical protein
MFFGFDLLTTYSWYGTNSGVWKSYGELPLLRRLGARDLPIEKGTARSIAAWASTTRAITRLVKRGLVFREFVRHAPCFFHQGVFLTEKGCNFVVEKWGTQPIHLTTSSYFPGTDLTDPFVWLSLNGSLKACVSHKEPITLSGVAA